MVKADKTKEGAADGPQGKAEGDAGEAKGTEPEYITVRSARNDNRVAFSEQHKDHPNGEAFVYGETPVEVAKTSEVLRALNDNRIVEVK